MAFLQNLIGDGNKSNNSSASVASALLYGANIEMVKIDGIREANAQAKPIKNFVCVFVGGTGGIGASTAQELFRHTTSPRAYIVGRSDLSISEKHHSRTS